MKLLEYFPSVVAITAVLGVQFFPVIVGDMDNSGSLNAQLIHQITPRIRSKVAFQVELSSPDWTLMHVMKCVVDAFPF